MKDPKALFPFLFASSWLGDLCLTILAFYLAFTHTGPLTPMVFLTVSFCLLSGNLLPIGAYLIFARWRAEELRAEQAEASLGVRDALKRSEEVMGRLDEAEGALSKAILISRQVPERIAESYKAVETLTDKLNTLEVTTFTEQLEINSTRLDALQKESRSLHEALGGLTEQLGEVPASVGKLVKSSISELKKAKKDEDEVTVGERLDMVYESLEAVQDSLDGLLKRIAELPSPAPDTPAPNPSGELESDETEPEPEEGQPDSSEEPEPVIIIEEEEDGEIIEEPEAEEPTQPAAEPESVSAPPPEQEEMALAQTNAGDDSDSIAPDVVRLSARAMIGISNKIYIRGDEPWLSWDQGEQMDLIGIGEFAWTMDNLKESIEVALFLNDETPAEGGNIRLEPGKPVNVQPRFPR